MTAVNFSILLLTVLTFAGCTLARKDNVKPPLDFVLLSRDAEIDLALNAGPSHMRSEASVYVFLRTGYQKVRDGTNGMTCLVNRDGHQHGDRVLRPTCWDAEGSITIVPVVLRVGNMIAEGKSAEAIEQAINVDFQRKRLMSPRKAGIAYMLKGDVVANETNETFEIVFPPHYMIYAPGVSNADIGITSDAIKNDPSLPMVYDGYSGGSRTAYIIILAPKGAEHVH